MIESRLKGKDMVLNNSLPLMSMGVVSRALVCADPGVRTPIGASGFFSIKFLASFISNKITDW
jgi:hypothetical protein